MLMLMLMLKLMLMLMLMLTWCARGAVAHSNLNLVPLDSMFGGQSENQSTPLKTPGQNPVVSAMHLVSPVDSCAFGGADTRDLEKQQPTETGCGHHEARSVNSASLR
eukprot:726903-Rhodomonas_salina.2